MLVHLLKIHGFAIENMSCEEEINNLLSVLAYKTGVHHNSIQFSQHPISVGVTCTLSGMSQTGSIWIFVRG